MESEFKGNIMHVRAVEDSIRATKKYTEGVITGFKQHPVQGEDFPSKVFCKYYEVYPDVDIDKMSIGARFEWISGYSTHIDVVFKYDYRSDKASVMVKNGREAVRKLNQSIPRFSVALSKVVNGNGNKTE